MDAERYYITDESGRRLYNEHGDLFTIDTIADAEQWVTLYFKVYRNRYLWLKKDNGEIVCQYVRDMLAN